MANRVAFVESTALGGFPPELEPVRGITLYWESWDGTKYNLSDVQSGIHLAAGGLEGLGWPDIINYEVTSPMVHGSSYDGWLADGRKVFWNVVVYHEAGGQAWIDRARAFLRSFMPGTTGRWIAELPNGTQYGLTLRYRSGLNSGHDIDPSRTGYHVYGIELGPEQPFWEAAEETVFWDSGQDQDFYGPTGFGPPFIISSSRKMSGASITNRGDVEAYATWELAGPFTSASFGLGGRVTPVPFALAAGEVLRVNTDPRTGLTATVNGVDVMDQLPGFKYPAIPPGAAVPVALEMNGTGTIRARFRPLMMGVI